jgi:hypothetical protein
VKGHRISAEQSRGQDLDMANCRLDADFSMHRGASAAGNAKDGHA